MAAPPRLYDCREVCDRYFFPQPGRLLPRLDGATPLDLTLPDGTRVGGYWSRRLPGAPTIVYLHGNAERIADQLGHWPEWAMAAGANILFVDYPGYATSDGLASFTGCAAAATAALDRMLDEPASAVPGVVLMGRSVGSIFALAAAARTSSPRLWGLILESGIADLRPRLDLRVPYEELGLDRPAIHAELARDFDHEAEVQALGCPVLVLHARQDSLVPCWNGERLAAWAGPKLHRLLVFEQGDHNDLMWVNARAYVAALTEFVASLPRAAR